MTELRLDGDLSLRQWQRGDEAEIFEVVERNYDHLATFMDWLKPNHSVADYRDFIEREIVGANERTSLGFGIYRGNRLIGSIGFALFDHDAGVTEIGYWIDSREQGHGIVTKACTSLIDYAFGELDLNRVQIRCAVGNDRSAAVAERLGFRLEGIQRQHVKRNGIIYDFATYGLLASEWNEQNRQL